jgi:predicted SnoaL-like aldol condensation-catalyzing enzyme
MDLGDFLNRYTDEVYRDRDAGAARRFIADPCVRHEAGERLVMSLDENVKRIEGFLGQYPDVSIANRHVVADGEHVVTCYEIGLGGGTAISGIEVFRVVNDLIVETWNSKAAEGAWG